MKRDKCNYQIKGANERERGRERVKGEKNKIEKRGIEIEGWGGERKEGIEISKRESEIWETYYLLCIVLSSISISE